MFVKQLTSSLILEHLNFFTYKWRKKAIESANERDTGKKVSSFAIQVLNICGSDIIYEIRLIQ